MRRLMLVIAMTGLFFVVVAPMSVAQTPIAPPPVTGPDGQPLTEPEYTPSPPVQPSPTGTRPTGSPTPCRCQESAQPLPKPSSMSIWWLILIPLYIITVIIMYKIGKVSGSDSTGSPAA